MRIPHPVALRQTTVMAALCVSALSARAPGQDTAVVFIHGINSGGYVWDYMLATLQQDLRINPVRPSLDWKPPVTQQAVELSTFLNGNPATSDPSRWMPFVGHSNGGLDSREYSRIGGRLRQLATVGTPHTGAPLANNWIFGNILGLGEYMMDALFAPIDFYADEDMGNPEIIDLAYYAMLPFWGLANGLDALMCPIAGFCIVEMAGTWVIAPVIYDLQAGSGATAQLNTQENLGREASVTTARVGLRTSTNPQGALFDLVSDSPGAWIDARDVTIALYLLGYDHYRHHWDPFLQMYAYLWVDGAVALIDLDANWQFLIGTLIYYERQVSPDYGEWYTYMVSYPSDGVVPNASQFYPGGTRNEWLSAFNISHADQMSSPFVRDGLRDALERDFQIPRRSSSPPPPGTVSWVAISGPTMTRPGTPCHWTASANTPDAGYEWFVNDISSGSGSDFYYVAQSSFTLRVVASGGGGSASDSRWIDVNPAYGTCLEQ